ncbi:diol dehydratase-reactivating factor alpha subunit [Clostridium pasteurianum DSM 525 = ATCC 6013]|uniref:Diol dehydratase-reactivating factor alpha subunit n=1 Tax=Clostridium pasteurianum DSM 525 = ATCC 6013 TaxID=1262449 RepID=A0A0H3J8Q7_CLOPA|nr:diol dehydratase reactivase subunit alpha [Clostridium pasteurianum]AJA48348.1 diol dehydratase-reactivating factor alpha subunit [Clostridium pasteurianum DSM 525 = ATCC 6013]AJA52336.1 diol dehydratase-reactivating factor alpha subunit [Clostridium pasteurianum DSM 525 = ATCC 6013]AOZ75594.1 diol dehydratase reactivase subunit alpha [Clostridium pasteurianum DSM 525 = ATCC 6013]AOZ79390.1 diol dehydratase reactivase subunit alpha [Clostridium pasteurianum]ELP60502.1 glycerol dehydratase r
MKFVAGIDIGNATTEVAIAKIEDGNKIEFVSSGIVKTTGIKGTKQNIKGVIDSLNQALEKCSTDIENLGLIRINEAAPVIGDVAMETITETIITESTMIGHNPSTPGGIGTGVGITVDIEELESIKNNNTVIVIILKKVDFEYAAKTINKYLKKGVNIVGAIVQRDDGVLINNRLDKVIPIVDEVTLLEKVPLNMKAAVEVAPQGGVVEVLSNPYGIATVFNLNAEETKLVVPISRALIGNRSAVVIKTPKGDVQERRIPAGKINITGIRRTSVVDVEDGASKIMEVVKSTVSIEDIKGESGTNVGGMFERVRQVMSKLTNQDFQSIKIQDILAVDTFVPQKIVGGLAREFSLENAVGIAAMVKADKLQMQIIADELKNKLSVEVEIGGVEAEMAILGALTTPGSNKPLAILDMGAGSTDASIINKNGEISSVHLAGAGNMVTMLINSELGLNSFDLAEDIKRYPLAKVESLFHIRHEDGTVEFFEEHFDPSIFARTVILKEGNLIPINIEASIEKIKMIRKMAKEKVFVTNCIRALSIVSPTGSIRDIEFVVLVGGSSLDFQVPQLITDALSKYGVVAGRGNIRGLEGPRNAVATGLILDINKDR